MCSTPKTNNNKIFMKAHTTTVLSSEQMARFTEVANAAEDRKELKRQERRAIKAAEEGARRLNIKSKVKNTKKHKRDWFSFLSVDINPFSKKTAAKISLIICR